MERKDIKPVFVEADEILDTDTDNGIVRLTSGREVRVSRIRILAEHALEPFSPSIDQHVTAYADTARQLGGRSGSEWSDIWHNRPA